MIISGIIAGLAIGIACILYCLAPNPIIGAGLFALGLLAVRINKSDLFTGKIQHWGKPGYSTIDMNAMLWGNFGGIFLMVLLASICFPSVVATAGTIGATKIAVPLLTTFGKAILCGYIMTLATKSDTPLWLSAVCVFAFVCTGLNHCIADMFYYLLTPNDSFYIPLGVTVIGNIIGGRVGRV
jgi:formate/nitrite transporter FocA (FNT family)